MSTNARKPKTIAKGIERIAGKGGMRTMVSLLHGGKLRSHTIILPKDLETIESALFILPESTFEALGQADVLISLMAHFQGAEIVILCEQKTAAYFKKLAGVTSIYPYDLETRYVSSREFKALGDMLAREKFGICICLERNPDPSLLQIILRTSATVRVAYDQAAEFPFFNVHVKTEALGTEYERGMRIAYALGARAVKDAKWAVSKQAKEEICRMMHEMHIDEAAPLAGIDVGCFYEHYGNQWTSELIEALRSDTAFRWYLYADSFENAALTARLRAASLPVFGGLSASRNAALVEHSRLLVSGASASFQLARLLHRRVIGVFSESDCARYCIDARFMREAPYQGAPSAETIARIKACVSTFARANSDSGGKDKK